MSEKIETKNAPAADISFEVGFKNDKTRFDLRFISVSEENEIQEQFNNLADKSDDKSEQEYFICKNALYRFAAAGAAQLNTSHFDTFNIKNERIIRRAYLMFKNALEPDSNFF